MSMVDVIDAILMQDYRFWLDCYVMMDFRMMQIF